MNLKKAEMGMGTLIIFIALILVAAVAAGVLLSTTQSLQNKALDTGKSTTAEVGTSLSAIEVFARDGHNQSLNFWYETVKLSSGSEPIRFSNTLLFMNLDNTSQDYDYASSYTVEVINGSAATDRVNRTFTLDCDNITYEHPTKNSSTFCYLANESKGNETTCRTDLYGASYQIRGNNYRSGYLNKGDVAKVCFVSPRGIIESETVKITLLPMVGSPLVIETTTPNLMVNTMIPIYP